MGQAKSLAILYLIPEFRIIFIQMEKCGDIALVRVPVVITDKALSGKAVYVLFNV